MAEQMPPAGLRREMHHMGEAVLGEQRRHADTGGEVEPDETKRRRLCELVEARLLERRIVIGVEIVETEDVAAIRGETARDMESDESGGAGDEDRLIRHRRVPSSEATPARSQTPQLDCFGLGGAD